MRICSTCVYYAKKNTPPSPTSLIRTTSYPPHIVVSRDRTCAKAREISSLVRGLERPVVSAYKNTRNQRASRRIVDIGAKDLYTHRHTLPCPIEQLTSC